MDFGYSYSRQTYNKKGWPNFNYRSKVLIRNQLKAHFRRSNQVGLELNRKKGSGSGRQLNPRILDPIFRILPEKMQKKIKWSPDAGERNCASVLTGLYGNTKILQQNNGYTSQNNKREKKMVHEKNRNQTHSHVKTLFFSRYQIIKNQLNRMELS